MLSVERRREAYEVIRQRGSASVAELARALAVSVQTVRRDLGALEEDGLVERVHGGAVVTGGGTAIESAALERATARADEKRRIGEAAARLVQPGCTIFLSGGTTTEHVVAHLPAHPRMTVLTNAINIAAALARRPDVETIVIGGYLRHTELTLLAPTAEEAIRGFHIDQALYGCFGLDPEVGLSGASLVEASMDRAVLGAVDRLTVLADHAKFAQRGPVRLAPVDRIATLVTDRDAPEDGVRRLEAQGVEVVLA
jgi:DeoR family transcriptional regulator, aga operon transcriptional repressor